MFRQLAAAAIDVGGAEVVLTGFRPSELSEYLEALWSADRAQARQRALGPGIDEIGASGDGEAFATRSTGDFGRRTPGWD